MAKKRQNIIVFSSPLEGALHEAGLGIPQFPVEPNGRKPLITEWPAQSTTNPETIQSWAVRYPGCNFGSHWAKAGLCALDLDVKHGKDGLASWERLRGEVGELPPLRTQTPSGGFHAPGRVPPHLLSEGVQFKNSQGALGNGIDVRGHNGYTVSLGSRVDGRQYALLHRDPIPEISEALSNRLSRRKTPVSQRATCDQDSETDVVLAEDYLARRAAPAVEGNGGDTQTFKTAAWLKDHGISQEMALQLMLEFYNPRCSPPWDREDMAKKVENAYSYAKEERPGALSVNEAFRDESAASVAPLPTPAPSQSMWAREGIRGTTFGLTKPPEREFLYTGPGAMPAGEVTVTAGQGGCGKSLLALHLALSLASGIDCLSGAYKFARSGEKQRVVICMAEDDAQEIERRVWRVRQHLLETTGQELDLSTLTVFPRNGDARLVIKDAGGNLYPTLGFKQLVGVMRAQSPRLLILDPLSVVAGDAEGDNRDAAFVMTLLTQLTQVGSTRCTVNVLAHVSKMSIDSKGGQQAKHRAAAEAALSRALSPTAVRGSSAIVDGSRWTQTMCLVPADIKKALGADPHQQIVAYSVGKTNYGPRLEIAYFENRNGILLPFVASGVSSETVREIILNAIRAEGAVAKADLTRNATVFARELWDKTMLGQKAFRDLIQEMVEDGALIETKEGKKTLLEAP